MLRVGHFAGMIGCVRGGCDCLPQRPECTTLLRDPGTIGTFQSTHPA